MPDYIHIYIERTYRFSPIAASDTSYYRTVSNDSAQYAEYVQGLVAPSWPEQRKYKLAVHPVEITIGI